MKCQCLPRRHSKFSKFLYIDVTSTAIAKTMMPLPKGSLPTGTASPKTENSPLRMADKPNDRHTGLYTPKHHPHLPSDWPHAHSPQRYASLGGPSRRTKGYAFTPSLTPPNNSYKKFARQHSEASITPHYTNALSSIPKPAGLAPPT